MPRKLREEVAGGVFHVYARGNNRAPVFHCRADCELYLSMLARVVQRQGWRCLGYCLMPNHVHLLAETPRPNLGPGMQRLHGDYARRFNERHGRSGHVFQGRYGAVRMRSDAQLWMTARYIARNPVAAGLCDTPDDWEWSSHQAIVGRARRRGLDVARLLEYFTGAGGDGAQRYAELVAVG